MATGNIEKAANMVKKQLASTEPSSPVANVKKGAATDLLKRIKTVQRVAQKRAPGRPTMDEAGKLRDALLVTALNSFMQYGFEGASIEKIAREAKIAKITIYRQFGDKQTLFLEVARYAQGSIRGHMQEAVAIDGTPEEVLRNIIRRFRTITIRADYLAVLRLVIAETPRFPEIGEAMLEQTDYAIAPVVEYIEKLQKAGLIVVANPNHAAIQLAALAVGGLRYLLHASNEDAASTEHWVDSIYMTFARAWGLVPAVTPKRVAQSAK